MSLSFYVLSVGQRPVQHPNTFSLVKDRWDDFTFRTTFRLHYSDSDSTLRDIGTVKIARFGMGEEKATTELPSSFSSVPDQFFSLGQDREYYDKIRSLPESLGQKLLKALKDVAFDLSLLESAQEEPVVRISLMRDLDLPVVRSQFHWIAQGQAPRTSYNFTYTPPARESVQPDSLTFAVEVDSVPPSNVHVLIGANGVGKSTLMRCFAASLRTDADPSRVGDFASAKSHADGQRRVPFDNLVTVTFSAFDQFPAELDDPSGVNGDIPHHVVGLSSKRDDEAKPRDLGKQFAESLRPCLRTPRRERWLESLGILAVADPLLRAKHAEELLDAAVVGNEVAGARKFFDTLSSGHKIALLTMTSMVRYVEERTLLLIDEPETHLHPPLLSALIQVATRLSVERNGVAILATHSPVVLQEVPRSCVFVVRRNGNHLTAVPPRIETFGESVSVLTSAVFGLDVTETGYHSILRRVRAGSDMDSLQAQLGGEGRAILRALTDDDADADEIGEEY